MSNLNERVYLTKTALSRALGLDPRDKTITDLKPDAFLTTGNKRLDLYVAALADSLKNAQARQQEEE
jgi:hypothetical protein